MKFSIPIIWVFFPPVFKIFIAILFVYIWLFRFCHKSFIVCSIHIYGHYWHFLVSHQFLFFFVCLFVCHHHYHTINNKKNDDKISSVHRTVNFFTNFQHHHHCILSSDKVFGVFFCCCLCIVCVCRTIKLSTSHTTIWMSDILIINSGGGDGGGGWLVGWLVCKLIVPEIIIKR